MHIILDVLKKRTTPEQIKVAEWIRADAGKGASIASSSQMWNPYWADFDKITIVMQKDKNNFKLRKPNNDTSKELTYADNAITVLTWSVLKKFKTSPTIKKKKKSPNLL